MTIAKIALDNHDHYKLDYSYSYVIILRHLQFTDRNKKRRRLASSSFKPANYFSPDFLVIAFLNKKTRAKINAAKAPAVPIIKLQYTKSWPISIFLS